MTIERLEQVRSVNKMLSECLVRSQSAPSESAKKDNIPSAASLVQLSSSAQYLDIDSSKDIDTDRVQDIQNAIYNGRFTLDTDDIAKQLLVSLFELP